MSSTDAFGGGALALRLLLALVPVQLFLLVLAGLDIWRLVRPRRIAAALVAGAVAAAVSYVANNTLVALTGLAAAPFAILVAPLVEEAAKGAWSDWLVRTRRAGFLVDAALLGFAVGAGFATVENIYFLHSLPGAPLYVWAIRGLGTAVMHGGAAAVFAIVRRAWRDGPRRSGGLARGPGCGLAAARGLQPPAGLARAGHGAPAGAGAGAAGGGPPAGRASPARLAGPRLRPGHRAAGPDPGRRGAHLAPGPLPGIPAGDRRAQRPWRTCSACCACRPSWPCGPRGRCCCGSRASSRRRIRTWVARLREVEHLERTIGRAGLLALRPVSPWRGTGRWQRHLLEQEAARA